MYMTVYVCLPCCICMYTQEWDVISLNICSISINVYLYIYKYVMVKQRCAMVIHEKVAVAAQISIHGLATVS